jgi:hypothetical protein
VVAVQELDGTANQKVLGNNVRFSSTSVVCVCIFVCVRVCVLCVIIYIDHKRLDSGLIQLSLCKTWPCRSAWGAINGMCGSFVAA